jgi:hypothetical protein
MGGVSTCTDCGRPVLWTPVYNGHHRMFDGDPHPPDTTVRAEHWFLLRGRGLVPESMLKTRPTTESLTLHVCAGLSRGLRAMGVVQSIVDRRSWLALVPEVPLTAAPGEYEYTYRWPTEYAHIIKLRAPGHALCGTATWVGRRDLPREQERLQGMPVCETCVHRYERATRTRVMPPGRTSPRDQGATGEGS